MKSVRDTKVLSCSSVYETDPYGRPDQPKFLNAVAELETALSPLELLDELKAIEGRAGRRAGERWGPREIDLDVLLYDGLVFNDGKLAVPHAGLEKRKFVLIPFREIAPDIVHPVSGLTIEELAMVCTDKGRVVKTMHHIIL